jgi:hypothetical protein
MLSGHQPGYQQNRQAGGRFGIGDGGQGIHESGSGGGGGGSGGGGGGSGGGAGALKAYGKAVGDLQKAKDARVGKFHPLHKAREQAYQKALAQHAQAKAALEKAQQQHAQRVEKEVKENAAQRIKHDASGKPIKGNAAKEAQGKAAGDHQSRVEQVSARRAELDAKFGAYSEHAAHEQMDRLYKDHPELQRAYAQHIDGLQHLTPELAASHAIDSLSLVKQGNAGDRAVATAHAHEGFQRMREISEWSLLHQSNVTPEGTIKLYRGESGRHTDAESRARLESSGPRRGTPWSTERSVAESFDGGRVIEAHVPVEHILTWHGLSKGEVYRNEAEYTVGAGRISDYTIAPGTGDTGHE